jgi:hypothetical protein
MSKSSRRWQKHQKKKKRIEGGGLDSKTSNFEIFWSLFDGAQYGITEGKHHHWIVGGNGAVNSKKMKKRVINT